MWFRKIVIYLFFFLSTLLFSQNVVIQDYTKENVIASNDILKIFQDSRQYFWVSTRNGMFIQQMHKFVKLRSFKENNFSNANDILEDKNHNMWFASYGDGVLFFDGTKFNHFTKSTGLLSDRNLKLLEDETNIYVGGVKGISIINKSNFQVKTALFDHPDNTILEVNNLFKIDNDIFATTSYDGVYKLVGNQLVFFKDISNIVTAYVYKNEVVITSNDGVFVFRNDLFKKNLNYTRKVNLPIIWDYALINDNKYWMLTSDLVNSKGSIYEYDDTKDINTRILTDIDLNYEYPRGIVYDRNNNSVYVSSLESGLKRLLLNMPYDFFPIENQLVSNIYTIGKLDFITTKNEFYIRSGKKTVKKVSVDEFYNYFQSHKSEKILQYNLNPDFFKINYNQEKKNIKFYQLKFHQNHFWIGSNIGLFKLDQKGNIVKLYPLHAYNFQFSGNLLVDAHPFRGVKVFRDLDQFDYKYYSDKDSSIPSYVVSTDKLGDKLFFASSIYGLYKYENGKFLSYFNSGIFKETKLKLIKSLPNNRILLATEQGVVYKLKIDRNSILVERKIFKSQINSDNILLLNEINGKIIIGTSNSLVIVDGKQFFYFDQSQGFQFIKMNTSSISSNKLLVGVDYGYYSFDVDEIAKYKGKKYNVIIHGLNINNKSLPKEDFKWFDLQKRNLTLSSTENNIYLDFSLINPKYPNKFKYRYRLNKKDKWSEYFYENTIQFNALNFGNYSIDLEITDLNGNRKDIAHLIDVKINPPFYLQPLFIMAILVLIGSIIYLFYLQKIQNIRRINDLKINQINNENEAHRKQITLEKKITEIRLLALQSQMNPHFIFNILNSIQYYIIDQDVENALNTLNKFARLIRKMLDLSREQSISIASKIEFLKLYVEIENTRYKNKVKFIVSVDSKIDIHNTFLPPMLLQPLIENAFVHGFDATCKDNVLELNISMNDEYYIFKVIDNGKGIKESDKQTNHKSRGLDIIKERLSIINDNNDYNFLTFSANNPGTIATLYLKKNYLNRL